VLGTQETFCIVIAGLFERDSFDLFLSEFDKPWVIHLRETCCCSTNLCTWMPNTVYKNRRVHRHQGANAVKVAAEKIAKSAETKAKKAEKALSDADQKRVQRERAIAEQLDKISVLVGSKCRVVLLLAPCSDSYY
jgi:hypothetical protein